MPSDHPDPTADELSTAHQQDILDATAVHNESLLNADDANSLNATIANPTPDMLAPVDAAITDETLWQQRRIPKLRYALAGIMVVVFGASGLAALRFGSAASSADNTVYSSTQLPLHSLPIANSNQSGTPTLTVSGQLQVSDSLLLASSSQPSKAIAGQLYFDKATSQLRFYDGKDFVNLGASNNHAAASVTPAAPASGSSITNITNITNVTQAAPAAAPPASVLLQSATPGSQQTGGFNVSGTGSIGAVRTQIIDSDGGSLFINPLSATTGGTTTPGSPAIAGYSGTGAVGSGGENGTQIGTKVVTGSQGGNANSISIRVHGSDASKHLVVALYDDDGNLPSRPGNLLASSGIVNAVPDSINTIPIPSVTLTANTTYWLAFNTDDPAMGFEGIGGAQQTCFWVPGFALPTNPFGGCFFGGGAHVIWLNYTTSPTSSGGGSGRAAAIIDSNGATSFRNYTDSTAAFQIQNAGGTSNVLDVDTVNGRIGIGKSNPAYRLDISGGDINMTNGRSLRFSGNIALNVSGSGGTTTLGNFASGGAVNLQADNVMVKNLANSATTMIADTVNDRVGIGVAIPQYKLDVGGDIRATGNLYLDNHLITGGNTPGMAAGTAACSTPTVSISGTDTAGLITVTTGTGCAANGTLVTVTFANPFQSAPRIVLTPASAAATGLAYYYDASTVSTTGFDLKTNTTPTDSTTYSYSYQVIQ